MPTYETSNVQQHVSKDPIPVYCRDCGEEDSFVWDGKLFGAEVNGFLLKPSKRLRRGRCGDGNAVSARG